MLKERLTKTDNGKLYISDKGTYIHVIHDKEKPDFYYYDVYTKYGEYDKTYIRRYNETNTLGFLGKLEDITELAYKHNSIEEYINRNGKVEAIIEVRQNGLNIQNLPEIYQNDLDIVLQALKEDPNAIRYVGDKAKELFNIFANIHDVMLAG